MSISNELSCDVAAAMLAPKEGEATRPNLAAVVLAFHTAMRQLDGAERERRRAEILQDLSPAAPGSSNAASGGH
ncbi:MAG TPA: hypothetical protein VER08_00270 [Pyrinomonadaceae bacterium]|nr:hypothetical protein [Pyrinomonadaceae bacterium]